MAIQIHVGQLPRADGSSLIASPQGVVQCAVYGPLDVPFHKEVAGKATLEVVLKSGCKSKECPPSVKSDEEFVRKLFDSVIMVDMYGRSGIEMIVQEMESDGDVLSLSINCITAAILDAGISMSYVIAAVTIVITNDGRIVVNPDKSTLVNSSTRLVIIHENIKCNIISILSTGEPYDLTLLKDCFRISKDSANQIFQLYRNTIQSNMLV